MMMKTTTCALTLAATLLAGCGTLQTAEKMTAAHESATLRTNDAIKVAEAAVKAPVRNGDAFVSRPWIGGTSVPLSREVSMPPALRKGLATAVLFKGSDAVDLMTAASQLTAAIKIPVRVRPDALMPASDFLPRTQMTNAAGAGSKESPKISMRLPAEADATEILNYIAAQTGVSWAYKPEQNCIEIFRLVTRTLEFKAAVGSSNVELGLGRNGTQGGAFTANAQTKLASGEMDPVKDLKAGIEAMLTRAGSGTIGGGAVVVTDTPETVDRVAQYVERENRMVGRRIRLLFEAIEVATNDAAEAGIDWELFYKRIAQGSTGDTTGALGGKSTPTLTGDQSAALSLGFLGNTRFAGSSVLINALKDVGKVVSHTKVPLQTQNKRPVQYALRNLFDYVAQVEVTATSSALGASSTPAIKQKEESTGTTLTITPAAFDDGQIMLSMSYDATSLRSLKPFTVGGTSQSAALSTVQQRNIDGTGALQIVQVKAGQTVLVSGFERSVDSVDKRRLDETAPMLFGGSDRAVKTRLTTLLLVTAVAED